jgi:hypothetical protein
MSHQIYIYAAPRDKVSANAARAVLEAEGMGCWIASRDLPPGADPVETARAAIAAAQVMLLIFSAHTNEVEDQVKRELQFAAQSQTPVLPFRIEKVKPSRVLEYFLPANQFVDGFPPPLDVHLRRLTGLLKPALEKYPPRPPMPGAPPAPPPETSDAPALAISPGAPSPVQPEAIMAAPAAIQHPGALISEMPATEIVPEQAVPETVSVPAPHLEKSPAGIPPLPGKADATPWVRRPLPLALIAVAVVIVCAAGWWLLRPAPSARELQVWNAASQQDAIPAYQGYLVAWPKGFYRDQAAARVTALKTETESAFAKAKVVNTSAAYENFLGSYAKQGVDVTEARAADDAIRAEEAKAKTAFDAASAAHTPESYKGFLADFGSSSLAAEARQKLAACHTETRNTTTVKDTPISENVSGSGGSADEACDAAKQRAASQAENSCRESSGRMGAIHVVSRAPQQDGLQGGRILGSIFGAVTGSRKINWKCQEDVSVSCEVSASGIHQVDICP